MRDDDQHTQDQYDDHMRRLADIRREFDRGEISTSQKREYIAAENKAYYGDNEIRSSTTGEKLCWPGRASNEIIDLIADTTGAPYGAARIAVHRRRELCRAAQFAATADEARVLAVEARESFYAIVSAAAPGGRHQRQGGTP